jgi:protein-S-isoprenylcysteine O-methyltransferase Ste14
MYLGMVLMILGLAIGMGTPPFYLSAIAFFAVMNKIFAVMNKIFRPYEEDKLTNVFGEQYRSYVKAVPRWI